MALTLIFGKTPVPGCAANLRSRKSKNAKEAASDGANISSDEDYLCLVRATDGKKKISTKVSEEGGLRHSNVTPSG